MLRKDEECNNAYEWKEKYTNILYYFFSSSSSFFSGGGGGDGNEGGIDFFSFSCARRNHNQNYNIFS